MPPSDDLTDENYSARLTRLLHEARADVARLTAERDTALSLSSCRLCPLGVCSAHQPFTGQIAVLRAEYDTFKAHTKELIGRFADDKVQADDIIRRLTEDLATAKEQANTWHTRAEAHRVACEAANAEVARLLTAPTASSAPLTVAEALRLPEVRSGAKVLEYNTGLGTRCQMWIGVVVTTYERHQLASGAWSKWNVVKVDGGIDPCLKLTCIVIDAPDGGR